MSYDDTGYDALAFKASHNSYQRDEDLHEQLAWSSSRPYQGGCRGVEIDITRHSDSSSGTSLGYFQVSHDQGGSGEPLADYLGYLLSWHAGNPGHDPVYVVLDIKSQDGDVDVFPDEIDAYLAEWFDKSILFRPGDLTEKSRKDLVTTVQANGWPSFSTLCGKFLFCLSGTEAWKAKYASLSPTTRLCFADFDVDDTKTAYSVTKGDRAIANLHLYSDDYDKWKKLVANLRGQACLVRGYVLNSESLWDKAQGAGVNILATDKVSDYDWAKVGDAPFAASPTPS